MAISDRTRRLRSEVERIYRKHVYAPKSVYRTADRLIKDYAVAYRTRRKAERWCSACGMKFEGEPDRCPYCGAKLKHPDICRFVFKSEHFIRQVVTYGEWQVVKEYIADVSHRRDSKAEVDLFLAYSWWYKPSEKAVLLYTQYIGMCAGWRRYPFSRWSNLHFINAKGAEGSYWYSDWRDTLVPGAKILPYYDVHGMAMDCVSRPLLEQRLAAYTIGGTILETLVKTGQIDAAQMFVKDTRFRTRMIENWRPWCIARRHGFDIGKVGLQNYMDYLYELKVLKKDRRNPAYICPDDFFEAHAATSRKVAKILMARAAKAEETRRANDVAYQARIQAERLERAKGERQRYSRRIRKFAALVIADENLTIRPLMTVDEFIEEGAAMQHCVFSNAYYARPECLIMSARGKDGERVETIEVNLREWKVVQSRAYRNGTSSLHDKIVRLVTDAMPIIKKLSKKPIKQSA